MIITFCGHAQFKGSMEYEQKVLSFLKEKIQDEHEPVEMYLGGYGGFDEFAYACCKKYKESHENVSLVFVTPYMSIEYQKNQLIFKNKIYDSIIYPEIEEIPLRLAIIYRNRYMIESADCVIAYVSHRWGGAYLSYQYAKRKGKEILNLAEI